MKPVDRLRPEQFKLDPVPGSPESHPDSERGHSCLVAQASRLQSCIRGTSRMQARRLRYKIPVLFSVWDRSGVGSRGPCGHSDFESLHNRSGRHVHVVHNVHIVHRVHSVHTVHRVHPATADRSLEDLFVRTGTPSRAADGAGNMSPFFSGGGVCRSRYGWAGAPACASAVTGGTRYQAPPDSKMIASWNRRVSARAGSLAMRALNASESRSTATVVSSAYMV